MPFMRGRGPVRRTIEYLKSGRLQLHKQVRIFTINYNTFGKRHSGIKNFVFWELPKLQYMNPEVQVATFQNMTPLPFIKCYMENGREMLIDVDDKSQVDILDHLINVVGRSESTVDEKAMFEQRRDNPANFGVGCSRPCICELRGQVPCPGAIALPKHMRGKYKFYLKDELNK